MTYLPSPILYAYADKGRLPDGALSRRREWKDVGAGGGARMCGGKRESQIYSRLALVFLADRCGYMASACWAYFGTHSRLAADASRGSWGHGAR